MLSIHIYQDRAGGWRWRATRGWNIVADSGEAYTRRADALRAWRRFAAAVAGGRPVFDEPVGPAKRKGSRVS